jgi:flagellar motor switch protein FliM
MKKYEKIRKQALIIRPVRFSAKTIDAVAEIHDNFSEFVRDALDEKLIKEQAILKDLGIK